MRFDYRYRGETAVSHRPGSTGMTFAPDTLRPPTHFRGKLARAIPFREAISALHDVVVSDLRFQPRDRSEYLTWLAEQEDSLLAEYLACEVGLVKRVGEARAELSEVRKQKNKIIRPFHAARQKYFKYLYKRDYDAWFVLDPVITVHPDEIFFECFSQDESSYGRLGCGYEVFDDVGEFACGTTNIDYSAALYDEFQKIRDYKSTALGVDPEGFNVETTGEERYREVKIDLPDSWVRGFLQVSSAMSLPARHVELHPMDVHNFCFVLSRRKEKVGPRSMRFLLKPGEPLKVVFEPWNLEVNCPRSVYRGEEEDEIRVWGRRRLHILERLIPVTRRFHLHLLGTGLPTFWLADLGTMSFTLGLSGWTANDWSRMGNFDLMAPRAEVDDTTKQRVFDTLLEDWRGDAAGVAERAGIDRAEVLGALSAFTQAGRVMYDLYKGVYRVRELSREPLPMEQLRFANPREAEADQLVRAGGVEQRAEGAGDGMVKITGTVKQNLTDYRAELVVDGDERLRSASCSCFFFTQNKLFKGPCEHILALRKAHQNRVRGRILSLWTKWQH